VSAEWNTVSTSLSILLPSKAQVWAYSTQNTSFLWIYWRLYETFFEYLFCFWLFKFHYIYFCEKNSLWFRIVLIFTLQFKILILNKLICITLIKIMANCGSMVGRALSHWTRCLGFESGPARHQQKMKQKMMWKISL
jgi:hypothetical protein